VAWSEKNDIYLGTKLIKEEIENIFFSKFQIEKVAK